jgi:hypothetical protein
MKVHFGETIETFYHDPEKELDLKRYRSPVSVAWPLSHQLRFEQTLGPILEEKLRSKILIRNLLAEAVCVLEQQIKNGYRNEGSDSPDEKPSA